MYQKPCTENQLPMDTVSSIPPENTNVPTYQDVPINTLMWKNTTYPTEITKKLRKKLSHHKYHHQGLPNAQGVCWGV